MHKWIIIKDSIITDIVNQEDSPSIDNQDADTVFRDDANVYSVGDVFSVEDYNTRTYNAMNPEEKIASDRAKMEMTMQQARLSLISLGLIGTVEERISTASTSLRYAWKYADSTYRVCDDVEELTQLIGITEQQMDQVFELGMSIDVNNLNSLPQEHQDRICAYLDRQDGV